MTPKSTTAATRARIPAGVWILGFVSMLMDISSEMIHSLLPLFMVGALGASAFTVGLIEGLAESTALMVKVFSGVLSDYLGKRKGLAVFGYALGALTKPLFAIAPGIGDRKDVFQHFGFIALISGIKSVLGAFEVNVGAFALVP